MGDDASDNRLLLALAIVAVWGTFFFGILDLPQIKPPLNYYGAAADTIIFAALSVSRALRGRNLASASAIVKGILSLFLFALAGLTWYGSILLFDSIRENPNIAYLPLIAVKFLGLAFTGGACVAAALLLNDRIREHFRSIYQEGNPF